MIRITGPHDAREVGTCNSCSDQIGPNGTIPGSMVYEVTLGKGSTFRLCRACTRELRVVMDAAINAKVRQR